MRAGIPEDVEGTLDFALFSIEELKTAIRERGDTPLVTHCRQSLLGGSGPHRALGRAAKAGADFAKAPRFLRTGVRRAFVLALQAVRTADVGEGLGAGITPPRAWTLFLLTPRLLLARTGTDGAAGRRTRAAGVCNFFLPKRVCRQLLLLLHQSHWPDNWPAQGGRGRTRHCDFFFSHAPF